MPSLSDILGQPRAIANLRRALESERIHHAWIFGGPMGVGKRTTAEAFAALLLDPTVAPNLAGELEADPDSHTQRLIAAGAHPDLHIITKELAEFSREADVRRSKQRSIAVDVIREYLIEPATQSSSQTSGGARARKVFIIDEAHLMAKAGANAALKILEEPPRGVVFILVTHEESSLLPTIRSRCQRIAFAPLPHADMLEWLKRENLKLDAAQKSWLLEFADGSPGRAKIALDTGLYDWAQALEPMLAKLDGARFPDDLGPTMTSLIDKWAKAEVDKAENASKDIANKAGADHMFSLLSSWARKRLRDAIAISNAPNSTDAALHSAAGRLDLITEAQRRLEANANMSLVFDNLAAQLAS